MKCYEGHILTVNQNNDVVRYLVEDGGKIVYVGNDLPGQYRAAEYISLGEKALIPAFVDTHQHFASFSTFHAGLNVMDAASNAEIMEMVKRFAAQSPKKTLIAFGASPYCVKEGRLISRQELDAVCPDKEIMVVKYDGHACIVNSRLLSAMESKVRLFQRADQFPVHPRADSQYAIGGGFSGQPGHWLRPHRQRRGLCGRSGHHPGNALCQGAEKRVSNPGLSPEHEGKGGCFACALDGCFGSHDAALNAPYADELGGEGVLYYDDRKVMDFCKEANRAGLQIELHAIGDKAFDQACRALKAALDDYPRDDHRHGIIHDCLPTPEGIAVCRDYHIQMPMQSAFIGWKQEPDEYLARILGHDRLEKLNPIKTFRDHDIVASFGSDAPCTTPDPIAWMDRAVNNGNAGQAVSVQDALRMCTYNGAWAAFDEQERGSLEAGKIADMAVLSENPYTVPKDKLSCLRVEWLYLSGKPYESCRENILPMMLRGLTSRNKA